MGYAVELNKVNAANALNTLVVGLGETGLSCVRFLAKEGVPVAVCDSREQPPGLLRIQADYPDVAVFLGPFSESVFQAAQQVVVSPGVSIKSPLIEQARRRGVPVIGDIEMFVRRARAPIVAITGSNGKSTVTHLISMMIRDAGKAVLMGGNVGTPALDLLAEPVPQYYVLELSSFQLETTQSLSSAAAVILNISPDHMDRYDTLAEYAAAKGAIYVNARRCIVNRDDDVVTQLATGAKNTLQFGLGEPSGDDYGVSTVEGRDWLVKGRRPLLAVDDLLIKGRHNASNALAALALGEAIGLPMEAMLQTLRRFPGLPHRMQWVGEKGGVRWFNDSKGTNVGATVAAIAGAPGPVVLIAGGLGKGQDFSDLAQSMAKSGRAAIVMGKDAALIKAALTSVIPVHTVATMADAVAKAGELAQQGDVVLLSPACASFDMFSGYEQRGDVFSACVQELLA